MIIIAGRIDLENFISDEYPEVIEADRGDALVDTLSDMSHPPWGEDWREWLEDNIEDAVAEVMP